MSHRRFIGRRHFIAGSATLFGGLAARALHGQPIPAGLRRVAICIGIDSYEDGLISLRAAVKGAQDMSELLSNEGFEVTRLLGTGRDTDKMVTGQMVFNAVDRAVMDGNVGQLVIYFSGHGVLTGQTEYWLLSGAPRSSSEALAVWPTAGRARNSGIFNVVFISDACRSPAKTWGTNQLGNYNIFPGDVPRGRSDVDVFYATGTGDEAVEMSLEERAGAYEGVYTSAFLKAFREPLPGMVVTLPDGRRVVPNKRLKAFLLNEVREALRDRPRYTQTPDAWLSADEPAYIAQVHQNWSSTAPQLVCDGSNPPNCRQVIPPSASTLPEPKRISLPAAIQSGIENATRGDDPFPSLQNADPGEATLEAAALVDRSVSQQREDTVLDFPGIVVYGDKIAEVKGLGADSQLSGDEGQGPDLVKVFLNGPGASVVVRFYNGRGTILPVLSQFSTHVVLGESGISDIRFNPLGLSIEDDYLLSLRALSAEATERVFCALKVARRNAAMLQPNLLALFEWARALTRLWGFSRPMHTRTH